MSASGQLILFYLLTWTVVALTPGPAVIYSMSLSTRYGFRHALAGVVGILLGHFVFFGCIALGLATLLATATMAFTVLRIVGAIYLFYLGVRTIASTFRSSKTVAPTILQPPARTRLLLRGFAIQITNPKALLFMSALLPQFIQPQVSLSLQLILLLAITIAVDAIVLSGYAHFALRGARSLRNTGPKWLEGAFGGVLVLFGIRLFFVRK